MNLREAIRRPSDVQGFALVAAIAIAAYANAIPNGFAFDDLPIIVENSRVHNLANLKEIWLTPYWPRNGETLGLYRPLTIFAFALQWAVGGGSPLPFHITNTLLHAAVSGLLFLLLARLTAPWPALLGAAIFAVHPVHTEAVANVVGQAELLAAAGVLGACLLRLGPSVGVGGWGRPAGLVTLYGAALLAKEHAIVLPGLLVLLDLATRRGDGQLPSGMPRRTVRLVTALAAVAAVYVALRAAVLGSVRGTDPAWPLMFLSERTRVLNAFRAWPEYARLLLWRADLSADYSAAVILPVRWLTPMAAFGAGLFVATLAAAATIRHRPGLGLPAAWFLVTIAPVSNLFFPIGALVAERLLYLPSVAVALAVAYAANSPQIERQRPSVRALALLGVAGACATLAVRTVTRNPAWKDNSTLVNTLIREHPESYRAQWLAAIALASAGDTARSEAHWQLAYRLWDDHPAFLAEFALFSIQTGRYRRAITVLERSRPLPDGSTEQILATAYLLVGRPSDALAAIDRALKRGAQSVPLLDTRARALAALGRHGEAAATWRAALRLPDGRTTQIWNDLAGALRASGDSLGAAAALDSARALERARRDSAPAKGAR